LLRITSSYAPCDRPGGNEVAFGHGGGFILLYRKCEEPWIDNGIAEDGRA